MSYVKSQQQVLEKWLDIKQNRKNKPHNYIVWEILFQTIIFMTVNTVSIV